jgi:hypothetical protein
VLKKDQEKGDGTEAIKRGVEGAVACLSPQGFDSVGQAGGRQLDLRIR